MSGELFLPADMARALIESQAAQITALTEANVKMSHQIDSLLERQEELVCEVRIDQAQIKQLEAAIDRARDMCARPAGVCLDARPEGDTP